ncbi:hypothetical protein [Paracoccus marinaquae]|uniref:Uncharacterized protein n=1 Tax=Paracoccus marinaquae TaxID=2841926 RepID=A0ABS6AFQ8_9RHOB|nr:hypothetical protein [Paracoccus marinaquae]MBU3029343.1 hypothetical protein [Paracoccus marinaquae]
MTHHADCQNRPDAVVTGIEALTTGLAALAGHNDAATQVAPNAHSTGGEATARAFANLAAFVPAK